MAKDEKQKKSRINAELVQLLTSVAVIGIFFLVEIWLIFYYGGGFVFPLIFGVLIILMLCLTSLNVYQIFIRRIASSGGGSDRKAEYLIYKQVKQLPEEFESKLKEELSGLQEEINKTQKKTAKAILLKVEEQLSSTGTGSENMVSEQFDNMKAEIAELKGQIKELKSQNENLSNQLRSALIDHEDIKDSFPDLKNEHKKVFDLLGSLAFRNDEIKGMLDEILTEERMPREEQLGRVAWQDSELPEGMETADVNMDMPTEDMGIPDVNMDMPTEDMGIPDVNMDMPTEDMSIPDVNLDVPAEDTDISGIDIPDMSMEDIGIPDLDISDLSGEDIPAEEVETSGIDTPDMNVGNISEGNMDPNRQLTPEEIAQMFANV